MWTEEHRAIYKRPAGCSPSRMTDDEWAVLEPLIPPASPGGRPRKTNMREAMDAILFVLRTGCTWRTLDELCFPPRSTVYNIFRKFQKDGTWEKIWHHLRGMLRQELGREASPAAGIIDSQTLKSAEKGGHRKAKVKQTQWDTTQPRR
jgi:transposase